MGRGKHKANVSVIGLDCGLADILFFLLKSKTEETEVDNIGEVFIYELGLVLIFDH